ncbi:Ca-activated chloride channel family protein [Devosia enhydra]|uniref:Ca-activated chloride channel family protein n=1 Tax=Devosia enhydra TaxID=665118 RepID=A0A1K2HWJ4_9HYPH|nr:VWA domain-containing protein [Devosia enhydra]SFZ83443.1 Ca-activated chloride channel family protein [Devosia enhydra]
MTDRIDEKLALLKRRDIPAPDAATRREAINAAMTAFDISQADKVRKAAQGGGLIGRLRSILPDFARNWTMDTRTAFGLSTAAVALVMLPLGWQLYSTTALQPGRPLPAAIEIAARPEAAQAPVEMASRQADAVVSQSMQERAEEIIVKAEPAPSPPPAASAPTAIAPAPQRTGGVRLSAGETMTKRSADGMSAAMPQAAAPASPASQVGVYGEQNRFRPITPFEPMTGDSFAPFTESGLVRTNQQPVSTFSVDVDTSSYSYMRRALTEGWLPAPEAIRLEELINYFPYDYPAPVSAEEPFSTSISVYPSPWNSRTQILHVGIKGYAPLAGERQPANLTFLIDTSGSMDAPDRLPLLKRAFALLLDQLGEGDTIAIVAYAGSAGVVLEPTSADDKATILAALDRLSAGGSTAGSAGIELAYRLAERNADGPGIDRVILATDGDFNVGIDDPEALKSFIRTKRASGVSLSVLGFGQGNLDDTTMQALAQNGNGNAAYIDSLREAQKVLVEQVGGTLQTIASDVKVQVEFNPAQIAEYRLIGYETRALEREDFNDDRVDAGDIGAGHTVTALYEITPVGSGAERFDALRYGERPAAPVAATEPSDELAFVKLRYKQPGEAESRLIEIPVGPSSVLDSLDAASPDMRFAAAVAAFGQTLRGSDFGTMDYAAIEALARGARGADEGGYRAEFIALVGLARTLGRP